MFRKWCLEPNRFKKGHLPHFKFQQYSIHKHTSAKSCLLQSRRKEQYIQLEQYLEFLFVWISALSMSQHWQEVLLWKQRSANISNWHLHMRFENSHHMSSLNLRQISLTSWPLYTAGHWDRALPDWIPHLTTVQSTCDFIARPPKMTKFSHFERFELNTKHKNKTNNQRTYMDHMDILYISNHKHAPALPNKPRVASSDVDDTSGLKPASLSEMKGSRNQGGFIIEYPSHQIWAGAWKLNTWQIPIRWLWCKVRRWSVDSVDSVDTLNVDIVERACHSCGGICRRQPQVYKMFEPLPSSPIHQTTAELLMHLDFLAPGSESHLQKYTAASAARRFPKIWFCSLRTIARHCACHVSHVHTLFTLSAS